MGFGLLLLCIDCIWFSLPTTWPWIDFRFALYWFFFFFFGWESMGLLPPYYVGLALPWAWFVVGSGLGSVTIFLFFFWAWKLKSFFFFLIRGCSWEHPDLYVALPLGTLGWHPKAKSTWSNNTTSILETQVPHQQGDSNSNVTFQHNRVNPML